MRKLLLAAGLIFFITFVFILIYPFYFFPDHVTKIKSYLNNKSPYSIEFDNLSGNLLNGFDISNIKVDSDGKTFAEFKTIKFHPNFTSIFLNQILLGKVEIDSGIIDLDLINQLEGDQVHSSSKIALELQTLILNNLSFIYNKEEFNVQSKVSLSYNKALKINIYDCILSSEIWPYQLELKNGFITYSSEKLILNNIDVNSKAGVFTLNGNFDLRDIYKSFANITLNRLDISQITDKKTYFEKFSLMMERVSADSSLIHFMGKMEYDTIEIERVDCNIGIKNNILSFNECKIEVMTGQITVTGSYNLPQHLFDIYLTLQNIHPVYNKENTVLNGTTNITGSYIQDSLKIILDLKESILYGVTLESIKSNILLENGVVGGNSNFEIIGKNFTLFSSNFNSNFFKKTASMNINYNLDNYQIKSGIINVEDSISTNGHGNIILEYSDGYLDFIGKTNLNGLKIMDNQIDSLNGEIIGNLSLGDSASSPSSINYRFDGNLKNILLHIKKPVIVKSMEIALSGEGKEININKLNYFINQDEYGKAEWINFNKDRIELKSFSIKQNGINYIADKFETVKLDNWWLVENQTLNIEGDTLFLNGRLKNEHAYEVNLKSENIKFSIINSILGFPQRLLGQFNGSLNLTADDGIYSFDSKYEMKNGSIDDIEFDLFTGNINFSDQMISLDDITYIDSTAQMNIRGKIIPNNKYKDYIQNGDMDIFVNSNETSLHPFNRYIPLSMEIDGNFSGILHLIGTPVSPELVLEGKIIQPSFDILKGRLLSGEMTYNKESAIFKNLFLETFTGSYYAEGIVPVNLSPFKKKSSFYTNPTLEFSVSGKSTEFEFLTPYFEIIDSLQGNFDIKLQVTGNLKKPIRNGTVTINQGKLNLLPLENPVYGMNGEIEIINNQLKIKHLTARTGVINSDGLFTKLEKSFNAIFNPGKRDITNIITVSGEMNLKEFFNPEFNIQLSSDHLFLNSAENIFNGYGKTEVFVNGMDTIFISGIFEPSPNEFSVLMEFSEQEDLNPEKIKKGKVIDYNVHIPLENGVRINNSQMDGLIDGDIVLSATGIEPFVFSGNINVVDGSFYFNGNTIDQITGNILLDPGDNDPVINFSGITNIAGNDIEISLNGKIGNPNLSLISISDPDLNQNDLLYLLVFTPDTIQNDNEILGSTQMGNLFTNYVENTFERNIVRNSLLDKFQFNTDGGTLLTGFENSNMNFYVGKNLSPNLYLNLRSDLNSNGSSFEYEVGYRLSRNMSIIGKIDDNQLYHLTYRFKYTY